MSYPWNIIGHKNQLSQLETDLATQNLSHAYLFSGAEKIGKFTIARRFAALIQCPQNGCQSCSTCTQISLGQHFDTTELRDDGHSIKIATIRETLKTISLSSQASHKIIIIENVERMTTESANALLKALEEPPKNTIFLLTSSSSQLLETIISRAREIKFQLIPNTELQNDLTQLFPNLSAEQTSQIVKISLNRPGIAIEQLSSPEQLTASLELDKKIATLFETASISEKFQLIEEFCEEKDRTLEFLKHFTLKLHEKIRLAKTPQEAQRYHRILDSCHNMSKLLLQNVNARLLFENLLLAL